MANLLNISRLNSVLTANSSKLAYINLNVIGEASSYSGWISNFHIYKRRDHSHSSPLFLDLTNDNDLFMLFVLASCWSRTGQFENATYFTVYLKEKGYDDPLLWLNPSFVNSERRIKDQSVNYILGIYEDIRLPGRKEISFRSDFYDGVAILASNWNDIKQSLNDSETKKDYSIFINKIRSIGGIGGAGPDGRMSIKIPLILRELRVAKRFSDIPGEWCCVPDQRVLKTCKSSFFNITFDFPDNYRKYPLTRRYVLDPGIRMVLNKSQVIYSYFGDLYDIPLFAYEDLHKMCLI
ncbi:MAG: hypothetical protein K5765_01445 [Clostridia bacterium]|nr:hypothetical protein [Clostridia bacterium]